MTYLVKESFGSLLKRLRLEKGLPLRKVAAFLDIDTSSLSKIEKNIRKPTAGMIEKVSDYFEVNVEDVRVAYLSDLVANTIMKDEFSERILKVAQEKIQNHNANTEPNLSL